MDTHYTIETVTLYDIRDMARLQLRTEWALAQRRKNIRDVNVAEPQGSELTTRAAHLYKYMAENTARPADIFRGFKAVCGDRLAGGIYVTQPESVDYIDSVLKPVALECLNVDPDYWRQGIATSLLNMAMNHAALLGYDHAILQVADDNHEARGLYEREGFTLIEGMWDMYRGPKGAITAVTYQRSLI